MELPLDREDVVSIMETLLDIRNDTRDILWILRGEDNEEEEAEP